MGKNYENTENKYAIIGAGPAGLAAAKNLKECDVLFDGFESASDVGGLWNIDNDNSTVYKSAHLISSKKMTQFTDFPMKEHVADYPSHHELRQYFIDFTNHYDLRKTYHFNTAIQQLTPNENGWIVKTDSGSYQYKGVLICNGNLSHPNIPTFKGSFDGEIIHSKAYKSADIFEDKRVLIIGAGNSGCDIAVDAVHRAKKVDISVRRGYHFVPKYVFGKPADAIGGKLTFPRPIKQKIDSVLLGFFTGDPENFGFPKPDHKLYESHPIVNSLILYHIGHGDINVKKDIKEFAGKTVHFKDGTSEDYDMILLATGYKLNYPFIDQKLLNWEGAAPKLYLNMFHPQYNNLFVLSMVEAAGIGWHGRALMSLLVARFLSAIEKHPEKAKKIIDAKANSFPDLNGGYKYMKLARMAYYVHKDTYFKVLNKHLKMLE